MNRSNLNGDGRDPFAAWPGVTEAFGRGVREALLDHKRAGNPVAVWREGKVVWIAPEDIVIPPDPDAEKAEAALTPESAAAGARAGRNEES